MDEKKLLFIFNPRSGKGQIRNQLLSIIDIFVKHGYEVTVYPTQQPKDALYKIPEVVENYDLLVCSGGDGTLDEVVCGMMHCDALVPVGYIPAGSTNDFAQSLKIPRNMLKAAETAVAGTPFPWRENVIPVMWVLSIMILLSMWQLLECLRMFLTRRIRG